MLDNDKMNDDESEDDMLEANDENLEVGPQEEALY